MRGLRGMVVLVAVAVLLVGCGGESGGETASGPPPLTQELVISTDGYVTPETVGILMAQERGYFERFGFEIWFRPPVSPTRSIRYLVGSGEVDLAISHAPQVVMATEKEAPIVAIGSLVEQPTAAMIWPAKSQIRGIADLKGRTVAIEGLPFQKGFLEILLEQAGLTLDDVKLKSVEYDLVPALVSGEADAIFGGSPNVEGVRLEARGMKPVVTPVQSIGVPPYDELVLIGRPDYLEKNSQLIRNFLSAVVRGTEAAIENPGAAARLIVRNNPDFGLKSAEAGLEETFPLLSETGEMDPERWERLVGWMREQGLAEDEPPASELLTDEYLPSRP